MATIEVTGTVERCKLETRKPFKVSRYMPGEVDEYYLNVAIRLADGTAVYFNTPAATRVVSCVPGAAVVVYTLNPSAASWMKEEGDIKIATPGQSNNNKLVPLIREGDTVTVVGSVKKEATSKAGNFYRSLNRVWKKA